MPSSRKPSEVTASQIEAAAGTFDLLSAPSRLHIVWILADGESDVGTLAALAGSTVPAASQHLAKLRAAGVVKARRDGRRQLYRVEDPHILVMIERMFSRISPDGTLVADVDSRRPPRLPRFSSTQ